ncbi:MAG: DUF4139 domain-containing protein [Verrucomicrobiota bacterium]
MDSLLSRSVVPAGCLLALASSLTCQAQPSLTIYNQNFAAVRDRIALDLKAGANDARFTGTTAHVEPDSVILRDPAGAVDLRILEQNYRADPVSEGLLLSLNEGREIEFFTQGMGDKPDRTVKGRIIRSGYQTHSGEAMRRYGNSYYTSQMTMSQGMQPIIEVNGILQFGLPGSPRFPALADDTVLKPTLVWKLFSEKAAQVNAEIAYLTGGMSWDAAYNVVSPETGDTLDLTGWVTMDNQSGKTFEDAKVQLVAGDVSKVAAQPTWEANVAARPFVGASNGLVPQVTEKSFDEYHLYTLPLPTTLHDRETKQVEFAKAAGVKSSRIFVYDGVKIDRARYGSYTMQNIRENAEYGTESNPKVWVMREFKNSRDNQLGIPLPRGTVRFYRRDSDNQLQFVGENLIDHTPVDETLRIYTGNAFDIVGSRTRTGYKQDGSNRWFDETFEISLRNHKKEPVEIRVVEHLYRWTNWEIREPSNTFLKTDAQTIEFRIPLKADEERKVTYSVHYSW